MKIHPRHWFKRKKKKHNRFKFHRFYLVGPMDRDREGGKVWRDDLSDFIRSHNGIPLNPYEKPLLEEFGKEAKEDDLHFAKIVEAAKKKDYDRVSELVKILRHSDLRLVDSADVVVVNLDLDKNPCGSYEELFTSNRQKKPIIVKSSVPKSEIPFWLFGTLPHSLFFETWDEVKEYLRHMDEDDEVDLLGRWVFFDLEDEIKRISRSS